MFTGIFSLLLITIAFAKPADSVVTINSATDNYQFVYNASAGSVLIKQKQTTNYTANVFQAAIPVAEMYNNQVSITNVECKVDGRTPKDFKPLYSYYGSDDIFFSDEHICYFPLTIPKKAGTATVTFDEQVNDPRYFTTVIFRARMQLHIKRLV
jgi:hypothetical protein